MSPVVFRHGNIRFQFYANEGTPREPVHIHAVRPGCDAKFWLRPNVRLAYNIGFDERTITRLIKLIDARRSELETAWHEFFRES